MCPCSPCSERFTYKRNLERLAEIDLHQSTSCEFTFTLRVHSHAKLAEPFQELDSFDSTSLWKWFPNMKETYDSQRDCLKAATSCLAVMVIN
ncbi:MULTISPECIES: hypothetical protein [Exiguobacterium]|uniref:hypothetical protein n=1 Tax=Exiguobacterium TaxID=33986 RepID=UPI001BE73FA7|nr:MULTISPECIES: hypothetical protein [Exiguobacterium]MCT4781732.1 hypothetical protein [Exiguobacterium himgiriensis]